MTAQNPQNPQGPQHPRIASDMFVRGGQDKTVSEVDLSSLLAARAEATDVRTDLDPQRSAEHWTPILIDTPGFHDLPQTTPADSLPPLPGLMYPNAG